MLLPGNNYKNNDGQIIKIRQRVADYSEYTPYVEDSICGRYCEVTGRKLFYRLDSDAGKSKVVESFLVEQDYGGSVSDHSIQQDPAHNQPATLVMCRELLSVRRVHQFIASGYCVLCQFESPNYCGKRTDARVASGIVVNPDNEHTDAFVVHHLGGQFIVRFGTAGFKFVAVPPLVQPVPRHLSSSSSSRP